MPDDQDQADAADRWAARMALASDHVEQHPARSRSPSQEARHRKTVFILRKGWRPLIFSVIVAITGLLGLYYKSLATPGTEGNFLAKPPTLLDVFVSDPQISVQLTDTVAWITPSGGHESTVGVQVHVPPGTTQFSVFMLSTAQAAGLVKLHPLPVNINSLAIYPAEQQYGLPDYGGAFTFNVKQTRQRTVAFQLSPFKIGAVLDQTKDATYGRLPTVGLQDYPNLGLPFAPTVLAERYTNSTQYRDVVMNPRPITTRLSKIGNSADYRTPYGGRGDLFWAPEKLSITERLLDASPIFQAQPVKNITPIGTIEGDSYVWRSTGELEPTFETTIESTVTNESNSAFLSGIFFGLAGAATIALVQEFPEVFSTARPGWFPTFKRRRRRTP